MQERNSASRCSLILRWRGLLWRWQWRSAITAARRHERNTIQTVRAIAGSRWSLGIIRLILLHKCIHRLHDKEVNHECQDQEGDQRNDESAHIYYSVRIGIVGGMPFPG